MGNRNAVRRRWYKKNFKKIAATDKKWRDKNPEKVILMRKKNYGGYSTMLHELKINGCAICGYNKCDAALNFHHVNPKDRKFGVNITGIMNYKSKSFIAELNKCILLCCNCHQEIHYKEKRNVKDMGTCNNCHKKIMYNKYKRYRKEILCLKCYDTRLERKAAKIAERKRQADLVKIATPTRRTKKKAKKLDVIKDEDSV